MFIESLREHEKELYMDRLRITKTLRLVEYSIGQLPNFSIEITASGSRTLFPLRTSRRQDFSFIKKSP